MGLKYQVEGLREELREALLIVPRTRGQLDGHDGIGSSDSRFLRSSYYEIKDENNNTLANVKSPVVTTLACKQFKQSPCPLPPQAFRYTRLIRDMNTNPEPISDWLKYCYGDNKPLPPMPTKALLVELLARFYEWESKGLSDDSKTLIKHLALVACQQHKEHINGGTLILTQVQIAEMAGKKNSAWKKSWAKRWSRLLEILADFDREGLDHVYECRRSRKTTRGHANMPVSKVLRERAREYVAARMAS
ncbi:bacteriophage antitermination protein Q [Vibrio vulnificus]|uniref:bacteriophage antitermination protein Q n=1 Tax=Vibrio vulnificus TaxID=672 RepID=UPI0019D48059|nr:bacteriophage antitermination protein Q [Vibrio vulnificus]MBN8085915.1 hypothetical protein [Vibrio vulnificus]MBN8128890.1 hypothetical protein [Vibrio vulnificus]HAS6258262.1 hypothetical protein [Vibrio vulnificus]HDY8076672.1 hypothetical protein [Vibrio vulnificus]